MFNQPISKKQAQSLNVLSLAYVGDAVWSLFVRENLLLVHDIKPGELHKMASATVNATAQAHLSDVVFDSLSEEEKSVFIRGRNGKAHHKAKNQSGADYRKATGMEALIGYLYLIGEIERIKQILQGSINQ